MFVDDILQYVQTNASDVTEIIGENLFYNEAPEFSGTDRQPYPYLTLRGPYNTLSDRFSGGIFHRQCSLFRFNAHTETRTDAVRILRKLHRFLSKIQDLSLPSSFVQCFIRQDFDAADAFKNRPQVDEKPIEQAFAEYLCWYRDDDEDD